MRIVIAILGVLGLATAAHAEFEFLEQDRSVSAIVTVDLIDYPVPGQETHLRDEQRRTASDFGLFDESVTASLTTGVLGARQQRGNDRNYLQSQIPPGPREVGQYSESPQVNSAIAQRVTQILFRIDSPIFLQIHTEILDPPTYIVPGDIFESGSVMLSLTGPNLAIIHLPTTELINGRPDTVLPTIMDELRVVEPGDYVLNVDAAYAGRGAWRDVFYDVRLTATPIPEPRSVLSAACRVNSAILENNQG